MGTQDLVKIATFCSISLRNFEIFLKFLREMQHKVTILTKFKVLI